MSVTVYSRPSVRYLIRMPLMFPSVAPSASRTPTTTCYGLLTQTVPRGNGAGSEAVRGSRLSWGSPRALYPGAGVRSRRNVTLHARSCAWSFAVAPQAQDVTAPPGSTTIVRAKEPAGSRGRTTPTVRGRRHGPRISGKVAERPSRTAIIRPSQAADPAREENLATDSRGNTRAFRCQGPRSSATTSRHRRRRRARER